MATFIFKIDNRQVELNDMPAGALKSSFSALHDTLSTHIGMGSCKDHHHEPVFVLRSEGDRAILAGFSTCCEGYGNDIRKTLSLAHVALSPEMTITTRKYTYKM
jgi:hypothetical protein